MGKLGRIQTNFMTAFEPFIKEENLKALKH